MDNIDHFVEILLKEKGVTGVDEEVLAGLKKDLSSRLVQFINKRVIESLPESNRKELNSLIESSPVDNIKIQNFLSSHIINLPEIIINAMQEFKRLYSGE
jgi:hypothetical protein